MYSCILGDLPDITKFKVCFFSKKLRSPLNFSEKEQSKNIIF